MATAAALAKRVQNAQRRARVHAETAERRLIIGASAAAIGFLERRGTIPVSIGTIPTKLAAGIALSIFEAQSSGTTRRLAGAVADTTLAIYGYAAGKAGGFIAGEEEYDDEV